LIVVRPRRAWLYRLVAAISRPLLRLLWRYEVRGLERLPPGGFVLAAGHVSNFDPWPLGIALSKTRFVRFMAKSELFWPPLSWVIRGCGGFRVRRGEADREALATARRLAREGDVIAMFPEGTRRTKGARKRREAQVHDGAARIALGAGVPLVPAAVSGTARLARLEKLRVLYGAPVPVDDLTGLSRREAARVATERLMAAIHELEGELASR
jgi:1-acyl-sn-glycerol-3-phosphate acyltransferase